MKCNSFYIVAILVVSALTLTFFSAMLPAPQEESPKMELGFPEEVTTVLENSCFDCHTNGAKSEKALNALNFSTWNEKSTGKKIHKLDEISEEVKEGNMPPAKYLKYNPDKALTKEQAALLVKWTKTEGDELLK